MYYTNGNYSMGGNFKIKKQAPIDDRSTVSKKIDLQNPDLFDGFTYNGMIVSVVDDTVNNGIYRLEDKTTKTWVKEGADSTGGNVDLTNYYTKEDTDGLLDTKQDTLVSGTSIKTINGQSVLGNGNIFITADIASPLFQPIITSPANGTVDYIGSITSTYSTSQSFVGVQDWVRWEASTDVNFANILDSYEGSNNLTNWTPAIGGLAITTVYVRTKQGSGTYIVTGKQIGRAHV